MAIEAVTERLEVKQYDFVTRKLLKNPPRVPLEEAAIEIAYEHSPQLVILDYEMPRMNGQAVARILKMISPGARVIRRRHDVAVARQVRGEEDRLEADAEVAVASAIPTWPKGRIRASATPVGAV